jgi:hypothetical protein
MENNKMVQNKMPAQWLHTGLAALVLAATVLVAWAPSSSADTDSSKVTWAFRPSNTQGPDGRAWAEHELAPGQTVEDHLAVSNLGSEAVTFRLASADGYLTSGGRFNMLSTRGKSKDAGTWIKVDEAVTVSAGSTAIVAYKITVPETAEPGDHAAGIAASLVAENIGEDGATVGVESRIGFRVMTRVKGELRPGVRTQNLNLSYSQSWNPFTPGTLHVTGDIVNSGNVRLKVSGDIASDGKSTSFTDAGMVDQEMLPGDRRSISLTLNSIWPTFLINATFGVRPTIVGSNGQESELQDKTSTLSTLAVPWPQVLLLVGTALVIFALTTGRKRSRRRTAALISAAREEGRNTLPNVTSADV